MYNDTPSILRVTKASAFQSPSRRGFHCGPPYGWQDDAMNSTKTIHLLIVEDNIADIVLMSEALQEFCASPFEITKAADGEEALSLLSEGAKFDVIILDLNLPKVGGHAFLERYNSPYPPIAVFTSSWNEDEAKRALALGAREVVHKPTSYDEYAQAVCGMVLRLSWETRSDRLWHRVLRERLSAGFDSDRHSSSRRHNRFPAAGRDFQWSTHLE